MTQKFEELPKWLKLVLILLLGWIVGGIYRIVKWAEAPEGKRNTLTLVAGILGCITAIGNVIVWVCDLVTEILYNKITILAD